MLRDPPPAAETTAPTAEKFAKYANGGSLSMCQIESVAFGINQCHERKKNPKNHKAFNCVYIALYVTKVKIE